MAAAAKTIYGTSIPPGITSPTRGQLRVRIDRTVLDHEAVSIITGDAARKVVETPYLSFHFWGAEDKASPVVQPSSLATRVGSFNLVFPIKTSKAHLETYFKHMAMAKSGLEVRVLMHSVRGSVTLAETASAAIGRAVVQLDDMTPNHPMAGWYSILTMPEDSGSFPPSPNPTVLGRIKMCITLEYFAAADPPTDTAAALVVMADHSGGDSNSQQQQQQQQQQPKKRKGTPPSTAAKKQSSGPQSQPHDDELVVFGQGLSSAQLAHHSQHDQQTDAADDKQQPAGKKKRQHGGNNPDGDSAPSSRPSCKPPVPRTSAAAQNEKSSAETADKLIAAGLKLRQQLSEAASRDTVDDVMMMQHRSADDGSGGGPFAPLTLGVAPHEDLLRHRANKFGVAADSDSDNNDGDSCGCYTATAPPFAVIDGNRQFVANAPQPGSKKKKSSSRHNQAPERRSTSEDGQPLPGSAPPPPQQQPGHVVVEHRVAPQPDSRHRRHHHGTTAAPQNPHPHPPSASHTHRQHSVDHDVDDEETMPTQQMGPIPTTEQDRQQQQQQQQQQSGTPLVGSFVIRVCVGQLALQSPCSAVKLVARVSPDVLFTTPPEMGCFVSPNIELPIADDDVVGFNVTGVRRLTSTSRVVLELYAKPAGADDFSLVGLSMAPICGSAATGVLRNVVLRNPLNAGSIHAQCDIYVSFMQDTSSFSSSSVPVVQQQPTTSNNRPSATAEPQSQSQQAAASSSSSPCPSTGGGTIPQQQLYQQQATNVDFDRGVDNNSNPATTLQRHRHPGSATNEQHVVVMSSATPSRAASSSSSASAAAGTDNNHHHNNDGMANQQQDVAVVVVKPSATRIGVRIVEARNMRTVRDGEFITPPNCFAVIDDVLLRPAQPNRSTCIEMSANWQSVGPDATRVVVADTAPRFDFLGQIAVDVERPGQISRICISVHHCRDAKVAERFAAASAASASQYLDPEQNPAVVELLQHSIEFGVVSLSARCLGSLPFDGWAHVVDDVTGDSVGQLRVKCELL